jgi:plastocyanin
VTYTTHTISAFVTNSASGTLQGRSRRADDVRVGVSFTAPIALARLIGRVAPREQGRRAVDVDAEPSPDAVPASIYRNAYVETRIVVPVGTTIEWLNSDRVVHTVTADDASWDSGAIRPGERWRASFHEPGLYTFHCGPHPFMRAVVVVR